MLNDSDVGHHFTPESIQAAYCHYKEYKTDRFTGNVKIPTGADGVGWDEFEANLDRNAANISRRILDCSYTFYPLLQYAIDKESKRRLPVKEINRSTDLSIHKPPDHSRILSVARIRDVLVQKKLYEALTDDSERMFCATPALDHVSYAYRVGKSVQQVAMRVKADILQKGYHYAFEADIKSFFDTVDHARLIRLVNEWVGEQTICGRLLRKYILIDVVPWDSYRTGRTVSNHDLIICHTKQGIPQGGVISGMLANLYLHEFDCWVLAELATHHDIRYYRYADDFIILTRHEADSALMKEPISTKLSALGLQLHDSDDKTGVRNIEKDGLVFVGFHFKGSKVRPTPKSVIRFKKRILLSMNRGIQKVYTHDTPLVRLERTIRFVNHRLEGPPAVICPNCEKAKDRMRNWVGFYASVINDVRCIQKLDKWIRSELIKRCAIRLDMQLTRKELKTAGLLSLMKLMKYARENHDDFCTCGDHVST